MELPPSANADQPVDLMKQALDEHLAAYSLEEIDELTAQPKLPNAVVQPWRQSITPSKPRSTASNKPAEGNTGTAKDARIAAVRQCLTCHAQRSAPDTPATISASAVATCLGSDRQRTGEAIKLLLAEDPPLVIKANEKSTHLTPYAIEIARNQPVACQQAGELRQTVIKGIMGCLRCLVATPDTQPGTITVQEIAACRSLLMTDVQQAFLDEDLDLPLVTTGTPGAYRIASAAIPELTAIATPVEESGKTCDERFITWVCETVEASPVKLQSNLLRALQDGYVIITDNGTPKRGSSVPVHDTGRFLVVGPALDGLREPAQQAVLHVLGMDELVYGRRLNQAHLKQKLGIAAGTSLVAYAQFALRRLAAQTE